MAIILFAFVTLISFASPFILKTTRKIAADQFNFGEGVFKDKEAMEPIDCDEFVERCRSEAHLSDCLIIKELKASDLIPTLDEDEYDELIEDGPLDDNGDLDDFAWMAEVTARYPYDENQKKEIRQIGYNRVSGNDMPVICINGHVYCYDNNKELSDAYNKEEDAHYLSWGKQAQYNNMRNEVWSRKTCNSDMFEYIVYWHDCDGAGYSESGVQYRGSDRMAAIKAKRYADEHCCGGSIDIRLLWKDESRTERINRIEEEEEDDPGVTVYTFADGTEGYLSPYCSDEWYYLDRFGELHGKWTNWKSEPYNGQLDIKFTVDEMD